MRKKIELKREKEEKITKKWMKKALIENLYKNSIEALSIFQDEVYF